MMMPLVVLLAELALRGQVLCTVADHLDAYPRPRLVVETCGPGEACAERWTWRRSLAERLCQGGG
jgi:hypothetical protein